MTTLRRKRVFSQRSLRPSLYSAPRERVEPFHVTFLKVLAVSAVASVILCLVTSISSRQAHDIPYREHLLVKHNDIPEESKINTKISALPAFTLTKKSENDAFGIAEQHLSSVRHDAPKEILQFLNEAEKLRMAFSERYGGELSARALLERSLVVLKNQNTESPSNEMAFRLDKARRENGVLNAAFGGSSAVAGYGNFFHQSFPFIMEDLLSDPLELLGLKLEVRNGALEHTSAFPYTWCRSNFLGDHIDVSSMDFGTMSLEQLETVIRNMLGTEQEPAPILVVRDSLKANERLSLIQSYVDAGVLVEPIIVDLHAAYAPYANVKEEILPPGFQGWKEFGAPPGAPGKVRQNLTLKQHELFGWLISMHVLTGAELVVRNMLEGSDLLVAAAASLTLPRPQSKRIKTTKWTPLLYGTPIDGSYNKQIVPSTECRTAFDPIVSGGLGESIIGGTVGDDVDLLHPKGAMYLSQGWVLDLEPAERREKQLMKQWDNLAFRDYTKAYYGVAASGPLSLFLPAGKYDGRKNAKDVFKYLVICGSNEKGDGSACNLERDVSFLVGGIKASSVQWIDNESVTYHGKRLCVMVDTPEDAKLVSEQEARQAASERLQTKLKVHEEDRRSLQAKTMGLALEIEVTNSLVTWHKGSCSIAHVVWESTSTLR